MCTNYLRWLSSNMAATINPLLFNAFVKDLFPGFRIKNFITPEEADSIARNIAVFVDEYKTAPGVGKAGETMVDHGHDFDEYAQYASVWLAKGISLPERTYLVNLVCGYMALHTGYPFKVLSKDGKDCFYGVFRKINSGAGAHIDDVSEDSLAFADRKTVFQSSVVLHLQVPANGGETIIWERHPQPGDKAHLIDSWQYDEQMLEGIRNVEVPCVAGELVILPTKNYHKVKPGLEQNANRISFSMFIVIFEDDPGSIYIYN